jgi:hypothetical protein
MSTDLRFTHYIQAFEAFPLLQEHVATVLGSLPAEVQTDFLSDVTFRLALEEVKPGRGGGSSTFMPLPDSGTSVSRLVVLRAKLDRAPEAFARYVIAHELAHAFLRNGGWGEITDREDAADALAASWGYPKPSLRWF